MSPELRRHRKCLRIRPAHHAGSIDDHLPSAPVNLQSFRQRTSQTDLCSEKNPRPVYSGLCAVQVLGCGAWVKRSIHGFRGSPGCAIRPNPGM
jgi:hypothetical protein